MSRPPAHTPATEAVEVRPWRPGDPRAEIHVYPIPEQPLLWIYTAGDWHRATVHARHRYPDQIHYQTEITMRDPRYGTPSHLSRTYRWDPNTMIQRPRTLTDAEADEAPPDSTPLAPR